MKKRIGFVSNSSSSSFICDVCGEEASGWDLGLSEAEMYECQNGHVFCESHVEEDLNDLEIIKKVILKKDDKFYKQEKEELLKMIDDGVDDAEIIDNFSDYGLNGDGRYQFPEEYCPVCQLKVLLSKDINDYLLNKVAQTKEDVENEIREKFKNLKELKNSLK